MRAVPALDLTLRATADRHGLVVLHCDQDLDHPSQVTGRPAGWVVPQRSVP